LSLYLDLEGLMKKCIGCSKEKQLDCFGSDRRSNDLKTSRCKDCINARYHEDPEYKAKVIERAKINRLKNPDRSKERRNRKLQHPDYNKDYYLLNKVKLDELATERSKTIKGRYSKYKYNAKCKKRSFTLSLDEFTLFWGKDCAYCGDPIQTIGLDRVDSKLGYEIDNVVSCCSICNSIKLDHDLSFLHSHIEKMIQHRNRVDS
jgi:hypothetical protein